MGLAAVMDLVLEEMEQEPISTLGLHAIVAMDAGLLAEARLGQSFAEGDEPLVDISSNGSPRTATSCPRRPRPSRAGRECKGR